MNLKLAKILYAVLLRDKYIYFNVLISLFNLLYINKIIINKFNYSGFSNVLYYEAIAVLVFSPYVGLTSSYIARKRPSRYFLNILQTMSFLCSLSLVVAFLVTYNYLYLYLAGAALNYDFYYIRLNNFKFLFYKNVTQKGLLFLFLSMYDKLSSTIYIEFFSVLGLAIGFLSYLSVFRYNSLNLDLNLINKLWKIRSYFTLSSGLNIVQSVFSSGTIYFLKLFGFSDVALGQFGISDKIAKSSLLLISPLSMAASNRSKQLKSYSISFNFFKLDLLLVAIFHVVTVLFLLYHFNLNSALSSFEVFLFLTLGVQFYFQTILLQLCFLNKKSGIMIYFIILIFASILNILIIFIFKFLRSDIILIIWLQEFILFSIVLLEFNFGFLKRVIK